MIRDEIRDDMKMMVMGLSDELPDVFQSTEMGIHLVEIRDVVPMVRRGFVKRGDPQGGDAQVEEVGQAVDDSPEGSPEELWLIPVACAVKPSEPVDEDMIDRPLVQPFQMIHGDASCCCLYTILIPHVLS